MVSIPHVRKWSMKLYNHGIISTVLKKIMMHCYCNTTTYQKILIFVIVKLLRKLSLLLQLLLYLDLTIYFDEDQIFDQCLYSDYFSVSIAWKKTSFLGRQQKFDEIFHLILNLQVFFKLMVTYN